MQDRGTLSPDPIGVQAQLDRMVGSDEFEASNRNRMFLQFVVEETLAGRQELIKAYVIATSVFGRGADFDPQIDSIVRIEAGRLRRAIERYYLTAGRADPIVISIPKGSYVPVFYLSEAIGEIVPLPVPQQSSSSHKLTTSILVPGFEEEANQSAHPNVNRGFTRRVVAGLSRFTDLSVFGQKTAAVPGGQPRGDADNQDFDYLVIGGTTISQTHFSAEVLLLDVRTGRCVWGDVFEHSIEPEGLTFARNHVADRVVRSLAQPYGVISAAQLQGFHVESEQGLSSHSSVLLFRRYLRKYDRNLEEILRRALEAAIVRDPEYAEAFACLSQLYTNLLRFTVDPPDSPAVGERALELAQRAIDLAPNSGRSHHALSRAYWFTGDPEASFRELGIARALNPYDTLILADCGQQHAMLGHWPEAISLLEAAYAKNPGLPSSYRVGFSMFYFAHGRFEEALVEAQRIDVHRIIYGHMMVAVSAIRLGRKKEAAKAIAAILGIDKDYGTNAPADLARRNVDPQIATALLLALGDAGLPTDPCTNRLRSLHG